MVLGRLQEKIYNILKKYKYAVLVLIIGLILMILPFGNDRSVPQTLAEPTVDIPKISLEDKLSKLLSKVEGAGEVEVMLTIASGEEVIYQLDENRSVADKSSSDNINTVTITDSERNQDGLVKQVNPEIYKGAIVLCHGADEPSVRLAIVEAVSRITGLGANCISILKMK